MATPSSGIRRMIRPAGSGVSGDDILAELQAKLKGRRGSSDAACSSNPSTQFSVAPSGGQRKLGAIGKSSSLSDKVSHSVGVSGTPGGGGQVSTKWHVQFSSTPSSDKPDQNVPTTTSAPIAIPNSGHTAEPLVDTTDTVTNSNGSPLRPIRPRALSKSQPKQSFGRIGPPPKIPPPQFEKSSQASSPGSDKPRLRGRPEISRSPPPPPPTANTSRGKSAPPARSPIGGYHQNFKPSPESSRSPPPPPLPYNMDHYNKPPLSGHKMREITSPPRGSSVGVATKPAVVVGGVIPKKKSTDKQPSSSGVSSSAKKELKRLFGRNKSGGKVLKVSSEPKDLGKPIISMTGFENETTLPTASSGSSHVQDPISIPGYGYQNVFEDEAFSRFDLRRKTDSPEGTPSPTSSRTTKKPKPLPRKNSISNSAVHGVVMPASTTSDSHDSTWNGNGGEGDAPFTRFHSDPTKQPKTKAKTSSTSSTEEEEYVESFNELESEIDRFADIANLPSLDHTIVDKPVDHTTTKKPPPTNSSFQLKKQELCKTLSHNPAANVPIERRTTPQERKELRHGVCSDGAQLDGVVAVGDEEDYISMNSISMFDLTKSSLQLPTTDYPLDPRASGYYLKILPSGSSNAPKGARSTGGGNKQDRPVKPVSYAEFRRQIQIRLKGEGGKESLASPSQEFVDSDSASEGEEAQSLPIHLMRQTKITSSDARVMMSPRHHHNHPPVGKRTSNSLNGAQRFKVTNSALKSPRPRALQYSDVTVEPSAASKVRKPSVPKKYRYQMVHLSKDTRGRISPPSDGRHSNEQSAPTLPLRSKLPRDTATPQKVSTQQSTEDPERIYYTTTSSLTGKTGLANTHPPPLSGSVLGGRAVWHEYVEIDEDQVDKMAAQSGATPPSVTATPTIIPPAQLFKMMSFNSQSTSPEGPLTSGGRTSSTSSTGSSHPYNVKPPEVPYRPPDDLDNFLVEHRNTPSGDYSYAAVPGMNLFGLQWLRFHAQRFPNTPLGVHLSSSAPVNSSTTTSATSVQGDRANPTTSSSSVSGTSSDSAHKEMQAPPTIPPKTLSLLREQGLMSPDSAECPIRLPEPYLNFVPVSTSAKRKASSSESPLAFSSKFPSAVPLIGGGVGVGEKRPSPPPKPQPYKSITVKNAPPFKPQPYKLTNQVRKQSMPAVFSDSNLQSLRSSGSKSELTSSLSYAPPQGKSSYYDFTGAAGLQEVSPSNAKTRELTRTKAHRKLSRQRSYSAGQMSASLKRKTSFRQKKQSVPSGVYAAASKQSHDVSHDTTTRVPLLSHDTSHDDSTGSHDQSHDATSRVPLLSHDQSHDTTEAPLLPPKDTLVVPRRKTKRSGVEGRIDRRSLAIILQNRETICQHLSQVCDIDSASTSGGGSTLERSRKPSPNPELPATVRNEKVRDLGDILLEVDLLLRKKVCTENDLLSAIESQLNIKLQAVRDDTGTQQQQNGNETQTSSMRGETVVESECDPITDKDVEDVVNYVSSNRMEAEPSSDMENGNVTQQNGNGTHPYENQTYDVMSDTQKVVQEGSDVNHHPYQNQVYGMNETSSHNEEETDQYENVQDWKENSSNATDDTTTDSIIPIHVPATTSKPRSSTFVEVDVDALERLAKEEGDSSVQLITSSPVMSTLMTSTPMMSLPVMSLAGSHDQPPTAVTLGGNLYNIPRVRSKSSVDSSPAHFPSRPRLPTFNPLVTEKSKQPMSVTTTTQLQKMHTTNDSIDENDDSANATSESYKHALQMADNRYVRSHDLQLQSHDAPVTNESQRLSDVSELDSDIVRGESDGVGDVGGEGVRDGRSYSAGQRPLRRVNARRRSSASNTADVATSTSFTTGTGVFTHRGGRLTNIGSGIEVVIPEGAIPRGKKQKIWFDVVQTVVDPSNEEDMLTSLSDSGTFEMESYLIEKKDRKVQLSPMVLIGPCDAMLLRPIKIKLPHCLPYRNTSWHLQLLARAQNSESEDWSELTNSIGLIELPVKRGKNKFYRKSCFQMHIDYVQVRTCQLGCFKLIGSPIRNGTHSAKKMVASVFTKREREEKRESVELEVFISNAIVDQVQALGGALYDSGYVCLERNIPVLLFGDGRDMELTLSTETNSATPLGTKVIPFGEFWRQKKVGQSHVSFKVDKELLANDPSRTLTLRVQQAGARFVHETNFVVS